VALAAEGILAKTIPSVSDAQDKLMLLIHRFIDLPFELIGVKGWLIVLAN
jgi:hypothetical protein